MQNRMLLNTAILLLAGLALGGCTVRSVADDPMVFDIVGPVAVDVESFAGDVNIYVDDRLEQATVFFERESDLGNLRGEENIGALDDIDYSASLEPGDLGPVLTVRTWTSSPEAFRQRANITITLPAADGIHVTTKRGRVYAKDIQGAVDISTTERDVRVMTNWPMLKPVTIVNVEGDIDYRVRGESAGSITAQTVDGQVRHSCHYGKFRVTDHPGNSLIAQFNDGTNPIDLRTVEGNIRISVVADPTAVGLWIIDP